MTMTLTLLRRALIAAGMAVLAVEGGLALGQRSAPVAVAFSPGAGIFVLEREGTVVQLDADGRPAREWYRAGMPYQFMDIGAGVRADGGASVSFVTLRVDRLQSIITGAWVVTLEAGGKNIWTALNPPGFYAGIALQSDAKVAFVAEAKTNQIYRVHLAPDGRGPVEYAASIDGATRVGPLALDEVGHRLLAGDTSGQLFTVGLDGHDGGLVAKCGSGEVRAIIVDRQGRNAYLADPDAEKVWRVSLSARRPASCDVLSASKEFREPSGLAIDATNQIWIADPRAMKLFVVPPSGGPPARQLAW